MKPYYWIRYYVGPFNFVLLFQEYYEAGYNPEDDLEYLLMEAE